MIAQIIGYTIPSLVLFACVWIMQWMQYRKEDKKRLWELKKQSQKEITQVRLRAYERLALLLERTEPEHLLLDLDVSGMTVLTLQQRLLRTVRQEFDHNLSQQVYVSDEVWDRIIRARDEMGAFLTTMAQRLKEDATAMDYATVLLTAYKNNGVTPHQLALDALKNEARQLIDN